jgi:signal transduction histidine kinase
MTSKKNLFFALDVTLVNSIIVTYFIHEYNNNNNHMVRLTSDNISLSRRANPRMKLVTRNAVVSTFVPPHRKLAYLVRTTNVVTLEQQTNICWPAPSGVC